MTETRWAPYTPGQPARILTAPLEHEPIDGEGWPVEALGRGPEPDDLEREDTGPTDAIHSGLTRRDLRERERPFIETGQSSPEGTVEITWSAVHADMYRFGARHPIREVAIELCLDEVVEYMAERATKPERLAPITCSCGWTRPRAEHQCPRCFAPPSSPVAPVFKVGDRVEHVDWGDEGVVTAPFDGEHVRVEFKSASGGYFFPCDLRHATDAERRRWEAAQ